LDLSKTTSNFFVAFNSTYELQRHGDRTIQSSSPAILISLLINSGQKKKGSCLVLAVNDSQKHSAKVLKLAAKRCAFLAPLQDDLLMLIDHKIKSKLNVYRVPMPTGSIIRNLHQKRIARGEIQLSIVIFPPLFTDT
jgi:hypothetical protein